MQQRADALTANNRHRGAALEELLNWEHNILANNHRALIWHNGTRGEIHRGRTMLVKSRPDYEGCLTSLGGRLVCFDAKMTQTMVYHHDRKRLHQLVDLWEVQEAGGISFLLVSLNLQSFYLVWPQPEWETGQWNRCDLWEIVSGHTEVGIEVPVGIDYKLPDWLSALEAFLV